jgi:hypothetical protein
MSQHWMRAIALTRECNGGAEYQERARNRLSVLTMSLLAHKFSPVYDNQVFVFIGAGWRIRTPDLLITNQPLYLLS